MLQAKYRKNPATIAPLATQSLLFYIFIYYNIYLFLEDLILWEKSGCSNYAEIPYAMQSARGTVSN